MIGDKRRELIQTTTFNIFYRGCQTGNTNLTENHNKLIWLEWFKKKNIFLFLLMMWIWKSKNRPEYPEDNKTKHLSLSLCLSPSLPFSFSFPKDVTVKKKSDNIYMRRIFFRSFVRCFVMWWNTRWKWNKSDQVFIFLPQEKYRTIFFVVVVVFLATTIIRKKITSFIHIIRFYVLFFLCVDLIFRMFRSLRFHSLFVWLVGYWLNITCCV